MDTLVLDNINLAHKAANAVTRNPRYVEDIHAAAVLGLVEASKTFNPELGKFSTWAWKYSYGRAVRQLQHLTATEQHYDTVPDHADETQNTENFAASRVARSAVRDALGVLTGRERHIVCAVHGIGHPEQTMVQLAKQYGVSRQRVSTIYKNGLQKLQIALAAHNPAHE